LYENRCKSNSHMIMATIFGKEIWMYNNCMGSVFGPIRFLLPVCRLCWFLYTLNIHLYMPIFRHIFLSNYWWQKSDIWSQASYRYAISAINSCWEKCDEKWAYMFNVYKNQLSRQTGSRNLTGLKMLPTIWHTYMKFVTKYQISAFFVEGPSTNIR
jgi:hypothetical protein